MILSNRWVFAAIRIDTWNICLLAESTSGLDLITTRLASMTRIASLHCFGFQNRSDCGAVQAECGWDRKCRRRCRRPTWRGGDPGLYPKTMLEEDPFFPPHLTAYGTGNKNWTKILTRVRGSRQIMARENEGSGSYLTTHPRHSAPMSGRWSSGGMYQCGATRGGAGCWALLITML